jgi:putative nucleotidyltransferase with HDIG domain
VRGISAGAVDFIYKPFHPQVVLVRVHAQLEIKRNLELARNQAEKLALANKLMEQELADRLRAENDLRAVKLEVDQASDVKDSMFKDLLVAMCEILSTRDFYTFEHGMRVSSLCRRMGEVMGLPDRELDALELGGMIHDISKVAIPDDVLLKPGLFDAQDRKIMRLHPVMGAKIFSKRQCDPLITDIIYQHHERLDGSGYPRGLHGDEIGLLPRLAMVADTYEAMVARRPYKKPKSRQEALKLLRFEAEQGRLDARGVELLTKVTENWDPLSACNFVSDDNTKDLEAFRRKTYFKEPLSDFYNYRYLFFLNDSGLLDIPARGYLLCKVFCSNLEQINAREGYLKSDQILDEVGSKIYEVLEEVDNCEEVKGVNILFRKGVTYLVYSNCQNEISRQVVDKIKKTLTVFDQEWQLDAHLVEKHFPADCNIESALYELLEA